MNARKKRNIDGTLWTYSQVAEDSQLGLNTVMKLARESGSLVKIGRISRVDPKKFYKYVFETYQEN